MERIENGKVKRSMYSIEMLVLLLKRISESILKEWRLPKLLEGYIHKHKILNHHTLPPFIIPISSGFFRQKGHILRIYKVTR